MLDLIPPDRNVSIEREVWPRLVGNGLLRLRRTQAYWLDIGTPERYLQGDVRHPRGQRRDRGRRAARRRLRTVVRRAASTVGVVPPAVVERGVHDRAGAHVGSRSSGDAVDRDVAPAARERRAATARDRRRLRLRDCIVGPAPASATARSVDDGAVLGEGVTVGARQRARPRASRSSRAPSSPTARSGSERTAATRRGAYDVAAAPRTASTARHRGGRHHDLLDRRPRDPRAPARRAVEGRVGRPRAVGQPGRPGRRRHGRLGHRRRAGPRRARRPAPRGRSSRPAPTALPAWTTPDTTVLCASYSGDTEETLAAYEAAGALGAQRVVVTTGGRAGRAGPRRRRPRDPGGRRLPAARRGGLHVRRRAGGRRAVRRRPADELRDRRRRRAPRGPRDRVGPRRAVRRARPRRSRMRCTAAIPVIYGAGLTDADRLPLEDPDQRERQAAGLLPRAARARPQRDLRLGGLARRSAGSRRCSSRTPTCTRASRGASS